MYGVSPEEIYPAFDELLKLIDEAAILDDFRCVKNIKYLVLDGLQYFSSTQTHCKKCNQKKDKKTVIIYTRISLFVNRFWIMR